jgi:hypothetical protein
MNKRIPILLAILSTAPYTEMAYRDEAKERGEE